MDRDIQEVVAKFKDDTNTHKITTISYKGVLNVHITIGFEMVLLFLIV